MDEKTFRELIQRISDSAIDEMVEDGKELNSTTYQEMLAEKFDRFAELLS